MVALLLWSMMAHASSKTICENALESSRLSDSITVTPNAGQDEVIIPIFSDVHGKISTLFKSVSNLQKQFKTTFPAVLITGDLGYFPYPSQMPDAIRKDEIKTETDLGFAKYLAETATAETETKSGRTLIQKFYEDAREPLKLTAKFYFTRGNHEDHELLKDRESAQKPIVAVDPLGVFNYLADGKTFEIRSGSASLRAAAVGGIHQDSRPGRTKHNPQMVIDQDSVQTLLENQITSNDKLDVLLTHQGFDGAPGGHSEITALIETVNPRVHFYGHASNELGTQRVGATESRGVPELAKPNPIVLLVWNTKTNSLKIATPDELLAARERAGLQK